MTSIKTYLCSISLWSLVWGLAIPEQEHNSYEQPEMHQAEGLAPLFAHKHTRSLPDLYTVHFRKDYSVSDHTNAVGVNITQLPEYRYWEFLPGYTAELGSDELRQKVRQDPGVTLVEAEQPVYLMDFETHSPAYTPEEHADNATHHKRNYVKSQWKDAQWNQQVLTSQDKLSTPVQYAANPHTWLSNSGNAGVDVYVIDSGIRISHKFFRGQAVNWGGLRPNEQSPFVDETMDDMVGHGTHVAGIIASSPYYFGLTDGVTVINVKAVGAGSTPVRIANAVQQITFVHNKKKAGQSDGWRGSVINMSFGIPYKSIALGNALEAAKAAGITLIAAAGNDNLDTGAKKVFPCCYTSTTCIASMDNNYRKAKTSNYGLCIDYVAPGVGIQSLWKDSDNSNIVLGGTSMAAPHAAAAAAVFTSWLGLANGQATEYLYHNSRQGQVWDFPPGKNGLSINTGINLYWKRASEPFRYAGDNRRKGIKTSNVWDNSDPVYPAASSPFTTTTNNPDVGLGPATGSSSAPGDEAFPITSLDINDELMSGIGQAFDRSSLEKVDQQLSWNTLMYQGNGLNGQQCGGVFTTQANGNGDRDCIKTDQTSNCIQAIVINGTQTCVVRIYSDNACKSQILLPNENRGLFGRSEYNLHMVATTPNFNSYDVTCAIR